jgi:hypothetical protein
MVKNISSLLSIPMRRGQKMVDKSKFYCRSMRSTNLATKKTNIKVRKWEWPPSPNLTLGRSETIETPWLIHSSWSLFIFHISLFFNNINGSPSIKKGSRMIKSFILQNEKVNVSEKNDSWSKTIFHESAHIL